MATRSILINFPKYYPKEVFNLVPDNGLANLAACLMSRGHMTQIWDFSTVDSIQRFFPYDYVDRLETIQNRLMQKVNRQVRLDQDELEALYSLEDEMCLWQQERVRVLGREISEYVCKNDIDFIGFKLWTGEGFEGSLIIAEELKRDNPGLKLFGGGPHVDQFMESILEVTELFDVLAYGEGEETIGLLADYVEDKMSLSEIPNLIYKSNGNVIVTPTKRIENLDDIPFPCYDEDVYLAMGGDQKVKVFLLDESRGCPNRCNFCIHPLKSGKKRRTVSPKVFVDRIEEMTRRYGTSAFRFAGSNPPPTLRKEIAEEILRRKLCVKYCAFAHVRGARYGDFKVLRESGCCALAFGVESGSQRILDDIMNKKVTVEQIRKALTACKEAGIATIASFIIPAPSETEETKKETLDLILETLPDNVNVFAPALVRGSEWDMNAERYHFQIGSKEAFHKGAMTFKGNVRWPVLWRPLPDYKMNDKTFSEVAEETYHFIRSLEERVISTQIYDQVFLFAEYTEMSPQELRKRTNSCIMRGDYQELGKIVTEINRNVLRRTGACYCRK